MTYTTDSFFDPVIIQKLAQERGLNPARGKGQNFLVDPTVIDDIVAAAALQPTDQVLEIGPGFGVLTVELAARAGRVLAVELDRRLAEIVRERTALRDNVVIRVGDILKTGSDDIAEQLGDGYRLVANIPYAISGQIFTKFFSAPPRPRDAILLVQREVAERIAAPAGEMSLLGLSVQLYGRPRIVRLVGRDCFWPSPAVDSAVLAIDRICPPPEFLPPSSGPALERRLWQLARIGFAARRKQLQNNLSSGLHLDKKVVAGHLERLGIAPLARAQDLTVENWLDLAKNL